MTQTVISYVPAIHQGYLNFFAANPGPIFLLGAAFVHETPRLDRDIRALTGANVARMLGELYGTDSIRVLEVEGDLDALKAHGRFILPDEDVNRTFSARHLSGRDVTLVPTFLRWDKQISTSENVVPPHRVITTDQAHRGLMARARDEAARTADWWRQVGAVIVPADSEPLVGHNRPLPSPDYTLGAFGDPRSNFDAGERIELSKVIHAEAGLVARAARAGISLEGASLFVTTFPCPVCARLVVEAGISRVYYQSGYSLLDAEDILGGAGVEIVLVQD